MKTIFTPLKYLALAAVVAALLSGIGHSSSPTQAADGQETHGITAPLKA